MGSIGPATSFTNTSKQMPSNQLRPTWVGFVDSTSAALKLFQASIDNKLDKVVRRPHDRERANVIKSGNVFIYEESGSGIKRWTDGVSWSPSRILGNFLIYRELDKPFPPGEKKRATKKPKSPRPGDPYPARTVDGIDVSAASPNSPQTPITPVRTPDGPTSTPTDPSKPEKDSERSLLGSLTDSYAFKENGLIKKTMSIRHNGGHLHLVSYYVPDDVKTNKLVSPDLDEKLAHVTPSPDMVRKQNFRSPINETDDINATPGQNPYRQPYTHGSPYLGPGQQYMATGSGQQYHVSQTHPMQHPSNPAVFYPPMNTGNHPAYQMPPQYTYADMGRGPPAPSPTQGPGQGQMTGISPTNPPQMPAEHRGIQNTAFSMQQSPINATGPHMQMHPDHSSYMQPYQHRERQPFHAEHYADQHDMRSTWPSNDGHV